MNNIRYFTTRKKNLNIYTNEYFKDEKIKYKLGDNISFIKDTLGNGSDLVVREISIGDSHVKVALCYIDGMTDKTLIEQFIMTNLMILLRDKKINNNTKDIFEKDITVGQIANVDNYKDLFKKILAGDSILLIDNSNTAISIGSRSYSDRDVTNADSEPVTKGPKDSFVETLRTNTSLIRRRIQDVNLRMDAYQLGEITNTNIVISYIEGLVPEHVVLELKKRIDSIEMDALIDSMYIEKLLQDQKYNVFPSIGHTERPDLVCAKLLEGRIAIIVDGTPFVIFVPYFFKDNFKATEEYYSRRSKVLFVRNIRYVSFLITVFIPALYIALVSFSFGLLPAPLLLSLEQQYSVIETPVIMELLLMLLIFEILKETSYRLPIYASTATVLVGGLVISQNVVEAHLVSPIMVIIIAITVVTTYIFRDDSFSNSVRILRLFTIILASIFGLLGVIAAYIAMLFHLYSLTSLKINYTYKKYPYNHNYKSPNKVMNESYKRVSLYIKNKLKKLLEREEC